MSPPFLDASIPELVSKLRTEEKISLLSGPNWWNTTAIPRLGIPSIRMSDGPNGVRGSSHFVSTPAQCLPCATALGSTFDPELIHQVGVFLGQETKVKSSVILLAPTCNIQRNPLGGRSFESFSEDPVLSGTLAAAYVNGLQSEGVSATIKHFVGNDQEHERTAAESVISPRALREIYLYPFMLAQKYAKPGAYMTSYGRINGVHCSESSALLTDLLRKEWDFDGVVISDWHGTYGADQPINAGLDLEMPGPPRWRQPRLLLQCLSAQKLRMRAIDERVLTMLAFVQRQARRNPEIVYGDGVERSRDSPPLRTFCRKVAAEGMVLLRNEHNVLPIVRETYRKIAVIGPGAKERVISGGGSAALKPTYVVTPWEGLKSNIPEGIEVVHELGCYAHKYLPTLENSLQTIDGEPGWICTFFNNKADGTLSEPVASMVVNDTRIKLNDFLPEGLAENWSIKLRGKLTAEKSCEFEFGLTVAGRAKLWIDDSLVIDNWTKQTPGDFFYGQGTIEEKASYQVAAGKTYNVYVLYTNSSPPDGDDDKTEGRLSQPALMRGVRLGGCEKVDTEAAIQAAVKLAKDVDAVIFVGGLTPEWEAEGFDRPSLHLPGPQDELIRRLAEVNANVIVCLQSGSAVSMPWVDQVGAIVQAWYSGNEAGNALADVIYGKVNPGGRLPLTFPVTLQDIPAYPNLHSENGQIHYREDLFVGYKHYQARCIKPLFSFGFGLSYTIFKLDNLQIELSSSESDVQVTVSVTVQNVGSKEGSEVVQVYIEYPEIGLTTPKLQLRGFGKAKDLAPGQATELKVKMDRYGMAYWNVERHGWVVSPGKYIVHVGKSSEELVLKGDFDQPKELMWTRL